MKQEFVEEQKKIARESLSTYDSYDNTRTYQAVPESELDTLISQLILATEGEIAKELKKVFMQGDEEDSYVQLSARIALFISTLTNKV